MFAYAVCRFYNLNVEMIFKAIDSFKGMQHRQSLIVHYNNIDFINDSKATNVQSTYWALKAFDNIALILGGIEKVDNLDIIVELIKNKVLKVFLIGKSQELFAKILYKQNILYEKCNTLDNATKQAYNFLVSINNDKKKTLLLSPACASFDQFLNFEQRGDIFTSIVNSIALTNAK
jgi:UDP-N-acetylmuramoylalanine--D-glutamate ligase